jgi:ubiquinone/menaquinone biosynthesis C-methylase UbiE
METEPMSQSVAEIARKEGFFWGESSGYFDAAERGIDAHWSSIVGPMVDGLPRRTVLDLASGHGRNAQRLAVGAQHVYCVDVNPENIAFLHQRFKGDDRFTILHNNGVDLAGIADDSIELFYCFDAMVHFDIEIVQSYIKEAFRVTRAGGHAFVHASNFTGNPGGDFRDNPHWRNFMSFDILKHFALKAGFNIARARTIAWGDVADLDCAFLLHKA